MIFLVPAESPAQELAHNVHIFAEGLRGDKKNPATGKQRERKSFNKAIAPAAD